MAAGLCPWSQVVAADSTLLILHVRCPRGCSCKLARPFALDGTAQIEPPAFGHEMSSMDAKYQVQLKVRKPAAEVFEAVMSPEKLSSYFVQAASAPLVEGTTVKWRFAEIPGEHEVRVSRVVQDQAIALEYDRPDGGKIGVEMVFL